MFMKYATHTRYFDQELPMKELVVEVMAPISLTHASDQ